MYSINQLYSKVMDMQAALQVTVDQVYGITQHLENREGITLLYMSYVELFSCELTGVL